MLFLGCDGGSTKTEWLLVDETGRIFAHRFFTGCNYAFLGQEGYERLMTESCAALLKDGGVSADDVTGAMFGLTVYGEVPGTEDSIPALLHRLLPNCRLMVENDSVAGWGGSLGGKPGIQVVSGTGSIAYGRDESHHGLRVGGWSLFFADEGSCSWIARQLIGEFVKQADGRHPRTAIYEALRQELNLTKDLYFSGYLQEKVRMDSSLLAKLQPVALRVAQQGDPIALQFYQRAAEELTEMAVTIRDRLAFRAAPVAVSYSGGLFRAGDTIMTPFRACMESAGFSIQTPLYSPTVGALALASEVHLTSSQQDVMLKRVAAQLNESM